MSASHRIVQVALPGPFLSPLNYILPAGIENVCAGSRVKVPFRNQTKIGLVMRRCENSEYALEKLKDIQAVMDEVPIFDAGHLAFLEWASQYYHEPIGEVVMAALPKRLREGETATKQGQEVWALVEGARIEISARAEIQKKLLWTLSGATDSSHPWQGEAVSYSVSSDEVLVRNEQLRAVSSAWRKTLSKWQELGWVNQSQTHCWQATQLPPRLKHPLNFEQNSVVEEVSDWIVNQRFGSFLLQGVTGSGKTEVYLAMIERAISQGKQALVLVPEIGLTPQMVERFQAYLQVPVATLHSGMSDSERHCAWQVIKDHEVSVLLGTRSAIFAPFKSLGLCILDEEHDLSYKQQDGFRYSARDLLIRRAAMQNVPVVLGSATPSLESLHNVNQGRFTGLYLHKRAGEAQLPKVKVLDIRGESIQEGVSAPLKSAMEEHLNAGNQVLLFLNRRGFAPVLMCHECGWQMSCPSCDANMTYHQGVYGGYLQCHHCDYQAPEPTHCPKCNSSELVKIGQGTERLEEAMKLWFPDKSVLRIDRDSTRLKGSMEKMTNLAKSGQADILLGTQMLAKGHDFPHVTLVGLLEIDQGLFSCDFRATERLAQLITQVSGRAGRSEKNGEVLIQSRHPQNPILTQLITEGYAQVAKTLLQERQLAQLPPFAYQILIRAEANDESLVREFLWAIKAGLELALQPKIQSEKTASSFHVWGPIAAPMLRRQGRFRYQLMLNSPSRKLLHQLLSAIEPAIYKSPLTRKVRWSIDVDPQEML
ncbi:primosomal protein N' [Thiomicrorhabdus indica]|uniref:primosomal protein N' n=1 Tax=Thiomicrorhabdus indica TaxID=2267253 RepID=UPI00102D88C0|nr:primosomal protein N' [Thiomicrorhabdus indica]